MAVTNKNKGYRTFDMSRVHEKTVVITDSASNISRTADEVVTGAETQMQSLDSASSEINEMATSLKETSTQAESVAGSADEWLRLLMSWPLRSNR